MRSLVVVTLRPITTLIIILFSFTFIRLGLITLTAYNVSDIINSSNRFNILLEGVA